VSGIDIEMSELAPSNARSPIEVTPVGTTADPAQLVCPVTTLSVIVNEPVIVDKPVAESFVMQLTLSAQAGGPTKLVVSSVKSAAILSLRRVFILFQSCAESL
jgi:hypothetical protein